MRKQGRFQYPTHEALARQVFSRYRSAARKQGREFLLSQPYLIELIGKACHYCKAPPGNAIRRKFYGDAVLFYSGIDRKDNAAGYVEENVVPCCARCNYVKGEDLDYEQMLEVGKVLRRMNKGSR